MSDEIDETRVNDGRYLMVGATAVVAVVAVVVVVAIEMKSIFIFNT